MTTADASPETIAADSARRRAGLLYGVAAYAWWGLFPLYFKAVAEANALEVLAHRIIWAVPALALLLGMTRRWPEVLAVFRSREQLRAIALSTALIGVNWFVYIYAVLTDRISEASLGFFINPLVSVALGAILLGERSSRVQWIAVALAVIGVGVRVAAVGSLPWIALALAGAFGFYGLVRKTAPVRPIPGLFCEVTLLMTPACLYLIWRMAQGQASFIQGGASISLLLTLAGVVTIAPLLWFTTAARRLPLATMGFLQYLAPTGQLLLAVLWFGEPFDLGDAASFALIWIALALYSADSLARNARRRRLARTAEVLEDL